MTYAALTTIAALTDGPETYMPPPGRATPRRSGQPRENDAARSRFPLPRDCARMHRRMVIVPAGNSPFCHRAASVPTATRRLLLLMLTALSACGPAAAASLGDSPDAARLNTRDFFGALALRLGPLTRSERLTVIRPRYVRGSLVPSRIFDDTVVWTRREGATRTVVIAGSATADSRYLLDVRPDAGVPHGVADSRHIMQLRRLGKHLYEWRSSDELAVGDASPAALDLLRRRLLGSGEGRSGLEIRQLWLRGLPRTTAALGRLFAADSVTTTVLPDQTTLVALRISMDATHLAADLPDFARWIDKYGATSRYRMVLEDHDGTPYGLFSLADRVIRIRLRTRGGVMQPLSGPASSGDIDSLRLRVDVTSKSMVFTVGVSNLLIDVVPIRTPTERGWAIHYRHEPEWHLPFAADHLMRGALSRPFAGEGIATRLVARSEPGGQTVIARDFRMEVQESPVVRWLSAFGSSAMSEVTVRVEQQKDRFFADALAAFGADLAAQIGGPDAGPGTAR